MVKLMDDELLEQQTYEIIHEYPLDGVDMRDLTRRMVTLIRRREQAAAMEASLRVTSGIRKWTYYNKHNMGEMGEFIRTKYVYNKLDMLEAELTNTKEGDS